MDYRVGLRARRFLPCRRLVLLVEFHEFRIRRMQLHQQFEDFPDLRGISLSAFMKGTPSTSCFIFSNRTGNVFLCERYHGPRRVGPPRTSGKQAGLCALPGRLPYSKHRRFTPFSMILRFHHILSRRALLSSRETPAPNGEQHRAGVSSLHNSADLLSCLADATGAAMAAHFNRTCNHPQ